MLEFSLRSSPSSQSQSRGIGKTRGVAALVFEFEFPEAVAGISEAGLIEAESLEGLTVSAASVLETGAEEAAEMSGYFLKGADSSEEESGRLIAEARGRPEA